MNRRTLVVLTGLFALHAVTGAMADAGAGPGDAPVARPVDGSLAGMPSPVLGLHEGSAEVVRVQGGFGPLPKTRLASRPERAVHEAWERARMAGLDVARWRQDAPSPTITKAIAADVADDEATEAKGTPTFVVDDRPLRSFGQQHPFDLVPTEAARVASGGD